MKCFWWSFLSKDKMIVVTTNDEEKKTFYADQQTEKMILEAWAATCHYSFFFFFFNNNKKLVYSNPFEIKMNTFYPSCLFLNHEYIFLIIIKEWVYLKQSWNRNDDYAVCLITNLGRLSLMVGMFTVDCWRVRGESLTQGEFLRRLVGKNPDYTLTFAAAQVRRVMALLVVTAVQNLDKNERNKITRFVVAPTRCMYAIEFMNEIIKRE